jgi:hypothetical protein
MLHPSERAAHEHDAPRQRVIVGEQGDIRPRPDTDQDIDVRELRRLGRPGNHLDTSHERSRELRAARDVSMNGADADELGGIGAARAAERHRVVGIVTDIGVNPHAHVSR